MKRKKPKFKKDTPLGYLKKAKLPIFILIIFFLLSIILGILGADILAPAILPFIKDLIERTSDLSGPELTIFILVNNATTSFLGMSLGIFFGIFPLFTIFVNGLVLGFVIERTIQVAGIFELWRLLPHGILELSAVFISLGLGLRLGFDFIKNLITNKKLIPFGIISLFLGILGLGILRISLNVLFLSSSPSLIIASTILFLFGISLLAPFIIVFFVVDKNLRRLNLKMIKNALIIFFALIIPLLLIAAIIEGILITLL